MRVMYIAGAAHSGSTLLDMMLNAHPRIFSAGELVNLNRVKFKKGKVKPTRCACGAVGLSQCRFWSRVDRRLGELGGGSIAELNLQEPQRGAGSHEADVLLFRAIAEVSGKDIIVDSSKIPSRLKYLLGLDGLEVYPIHLVREPAGQINSVIAKHGLMKSILYYEVVHAQVRQILKTVPHSRVKYEKLIIDPECTLGRVLERVGLDFHPRQLSWAEAERHGFAGNHIRFQEKSDLILDVAWKTKLTARQKLLIDLGTVVSQRRRA
jgi:hypothetical protein